MPGHPTGTQTRSAANHTPIGRDRRTAYHEAAHAVIAYYSKHGPRARSITIVPGEDSEGAVEWYNHSLEQVVGDLRRLVDRITICLAGNEAERRLTGRRDNRGADSDYRFVKDLVLGSMASSEEANAFLRWLRVLTERHVAVRWPVIEGVAAALLERKTLHKGEILEAIWNVETPGRGAETLRLAKEARERQRARRRAARADRAATGTADRQT